MIAKIQDSYSKSKFNGGLIQAYFL